MRKLPLNPCVRLSVLRVSSLRDVGSTIHKLVTTFYYLDFYYIIHLTTKNMIHVANMFFRTKSRRASILRKVSSWQHTVEIFFSFDKVDNEFVSFTSII